MKKQDGKRLAYKPPVLTVLGSASALTLGPNGGPQADGVFPHHSSA